jgi:solute carrier family 25 protein 33/36
MNHDHAPHPQTIHNDSSSFKQTLLPQSRETGEVVPPKQPDGVPVVAAESPFAKSWAHFIAGGYDYNSPRHIRAATILIQTQARRNGVCDSDCPPRCTQNSPPVHILPTAPCSRTSSSRPAAHRDYDIRAKLFASHPRNWRDPLAGA